MSLLTIDNTSSPTLTQNEYHYNMIKRIRTVN